MKINDKDLARFATSHEPADKDGYLWKKGELNTSYQKRWCVLKGNLFFYFEKRSDKEPIGVIVLENSFVQLSDGGDSSFTFSIHFTGEGSRVYKLTADDESSCTAWIRALSSCSYRYLKILVDVLQQNVETMEAKIQKNDQFLSNGHVYGVFRDDNTQKSSSIYTKAKVTVPKQFIKGLKKSKSMSSIYSEKEILNTVSDKDEFLNFNIFSEKSKTKAERLSKSHESLGQATKFPYSKTSKSGKNFDMHLRRSGPIISKKSSPFKYSKSVTHSLNGSSSQSVKKNFVSKQNFHSKSINFVDLHEQYRKDIADFIS